MEHVGIDIKFDNLDTFNKQIDVKFIDVDSELVDLNYKVASSIFCHVWRSIVSHMFFHCHEMHLHCFLLSVAWFQLALLSSHCFESFLWFDRLPRSFAGGSSMEKVLRLRLFAKSCDRPQWHNGYVRSGQSEGTEFKSW